MIIFRVPIADRPTSTFRWWCCLRSPASITSSTLTPHTLSLNQKKHNKLRANQDGPGQPQDGPFYSRTTAPGSKTPQFYSKATLSYSRTAAPGSAPPFYSRTALFYLQSRCPWGWSDHDRESPTPRRPRTPRPVQDGLGKPRRGARELQILRHLCLALRVHLRTMAGSGQVLFIIFLVNHRHRHRHPHRHPLQALAGRLQA